MSLFVSGSLFYIFMLWAIKAICTIFFNSKKSKATGQHPYLVLWKMYMYMLFDNNTLSAQIVYVYVNKGVINCTSHTLKRINTKVIILCVLS